MENPSALHPLYMGLSSRSMAINIINWPCYFFSFFLFFFPLLLYRAWEQDIEIGCEKGAKRNYEVWRDNSDDKFKEETQEAAPALSASEERGMNSRNVIRWRILKTRCCMLLLGMGSWGWSPKKIASLSMKMGIDGSSTVSRQSCDFWAVIVFQPIYTSFSITHLHVLWFR